MENRNGGSWLESVASHLVGKLPEKWLDDDVPIFIDQLRFMKVQYEEAAFLYKKNIALNQSDKLDTSEIEKEFDKFIGNHNLTEEEKQLLIIRLYSKYVKREEKN